MASRARSVRTEIVAGFATLIVSFGAVAGYSLSRQQRAVASLRLANETYLRLTLLVGEARATQGKLDTLLDNLLDNRDRVNARNWIALARRSRRGVLRSSREMAAAGVLHARDPEDRALLDRAVSDLAEIEREYERDEALFDELAPAMARNDVPESKRLKDLLLAREVHTEETLTDLTRSFQRRVRVLSDQAERHQARSLELTLIATLLACVLGVLTTLNARRALMPLALLRDRARAVAKGDLSSAHVAARNDEIGELAAEFERMVEGLRERDAALTRANAEVLQAERLAAIGRMAAHVTHEVRNPLSSMGLNAEMLADELGALGESAGESSRLVRAIQREIDRLTGITEEYLRVARLPRPRLEREELGTLVSDAAGFVSQEMLAAGVTLEVSIDDDLPSVMVDEGQFRQSLLNLLRNGREAMEGAQSGTRRLRVRVRREAGGVEVRVCDSGPGIPEEARAKLFELFFTTKERGTGLGLPLTREVIAAHGGTIRAERADADEGGGARFVLWLPAA